jgi:hypothetical protein
MNSLRSLYTNRPGVVFLAGGIALFCVLLAWGLAQLGVIKSQAPGDEAAKPDGSESVASRAVGIEGATVEQRDTSGKLLWSIRAAGKMTVDDQGRAVTGDNVHWEMQRGNSQMLVLEAPKFEGDYIAARLKFTGGVTVSTDSGKTVFTAPVMTFEIDTRKVIAEGGVEIRQAPYQCAAPRLVFDDAAGEVRLSGGVHGREDARGVTFEASAVTLRLADQQLTGIGPIRFQKGPYSASAKSLQVDETANRLKMGGGVRLTFRQ